MFRKVTMNIIKSSIVSFAKRRKTEMEVRQKETEE